MIDKAIIKDVRYMKAMVDAYYSISVQAVKLSKS